MKSNTNDISLSRIKKILLFGLLNSSFFIAFGGSGLLRLICIILMNISGIMLVYVYFKNYKLFRIEKISLYFRVLFFLLVFWSFLVIIRSISFDVSSLITLFGHNLMAWAWLTPLAIVLGFKITNWVFLYDFFGKLLLIASTIAIGSLFYNIKIIFGLLEWMVFFPILLLTYSDQNKKNKKIALFSIIVFPILAFFASQRAHIIFMSFIAIVSIYYYYVNQKNTYRRSRLSLFLIICTLIILVNGEKYFNSIQNNEEFTRDTRTFLYEEIFEELEGNNLTFGRGATGKYYSEYFDSWNMSHEGGDSEFRSVSEVGYLQIILKGGVILLILYLLILIPAAYLGIFKSNNFISKMSGILILSYLILWFISYYPIYSAEYILLWMAVGTTISSRTRRITDIDIKQLVFKYRKR